MAGINKVILVGRIGKDPELRYLQTGNVVCNFSVATSENWNDKNTGEKQERTEWHRIVVFGKLGEICGEWLTKGKQVYIEGKLQTREWEDKDKNKRTTTEIIANTMQILGDKTSHTETRQQERQAGDDFYPQSNDDDDGF